MTGQEPLFGATGAIARSTDPDTSHEAASTVDARAVEDAILTVFGRGITLTDDELCARLPQCHPPTVKSARSRLANKGWLTADGQTRPSNRGRPSLVWRRVRFHVEKVQDPKGRVA